MNALRVSLAIFWLAAAVMVAAFAQGAVGLFADSDAVGGNTFATDTLDPPTGLTATCGASITLDWTATADTYASGHHVLRGTSSGGPYSQIAEVTPRTTTSYVDSPPSGTHYYVVRAFVQNWESINSNEAIGTTPGNCPTSVSFVSVADTHADEQNNSNNYGTNTKLTARSWQSGKNMRAFVQFDVSSIPAGATIDSATLTLCPTRVPNSTRTYNAHRVTASWVETALTWSNQPSVSGTATDSATTPASVACMTWTLTSDVQAWVDGSANNGWRVSDSVESQGTKYLTDYRPREETGVPAEQPTLDVAYTAP